ncbi:hypothetical protein [Paracoccus litorisediminis]|uniref:Uncharacterized protein n=1 Tax=Paracoccus litorisediminis TaxID=2006130 RepID=A0A844HP87_9RHOB|nr:hypothetical protein [Paracoccus litorisediminis]MTH62193.1 hypothetical protein [Paracoccus litorisediminis]
MAPMPPALQRDPELREMVALLGEVVAGMSGRLDHQGERIDALLALVAETRDAAVSVKAQNDPQRSGQLIGDEVAQILDPVLTHFADSAVLLRKSLADTKTRLQELEAAEHQVLEYLRNELVASKRWRLQRRWVWIGAMGAGIGMAAVTAMMIGS